MVPAGVAQVPRTILSAVGFLTRLPVPARRDASGAAAFGFVGAGIGLLAALPVLVMSDAPLLGAALAVGIVALTSGGLHLDGLADTIDALAAPTAERAERARRDPAVGALGAAAVSLVLLADAAAIAGLTGVGTVPALIVAGASSRSVPVLGGQLVPHAGTGLGRWWGEAVRPRDGLACLATLALVIYVGGSARHAIAALAGVAAGVATLLVLARRFGAVTGDGHGAAVELAFLAALVADVAA
ncbi:MAG: adenosylcobinamide-GDP ribazoletransferase [Thermoleophilaceae bacterium]